MILLDVTYYTKLKKCITTKLLKILNLKRTIEQLHWSHNKLNVITAMWYYHQETEQALLIMSCVVTLMMIKWTVLVYINYDKWYNIEWSIKSILLRKNMRF